MTYSDIYKLTIPKGTSLYRKAKNNEVEDTMFFSFNTFSVDTNTDRLFDAPIQVWKTNETINTHFFVRGILASGRYETSIDSYYRVCFGETELCIGEIKSRNNENRAEFLNWIKTNLNIESWVSTVDDISEMMEFFSFSIETSKKLDFVGYIETDEYLNSFKKEMILDTIPFIDKKEDLFVH